MRPMDRQLDNPGVSATTGYFPSRKLMWLYAILCRGVKACNRLHFNFKVFIYLFIIKSYTEYTKEEWKNYNILQ